MGLVKNFAYKSILNFFSMILPILVMPYVYRKLSPNSIGMIEYGTSLFTYFSQNVFRISKQPKITRNIQA